MMSRINREDGLEQMKSVVMEGKTANPKSERLARFDNLKNLKQALTLFEKGVSGNPSDDGLFGRFAREELAKNTVSDWITALSEDIPDKTLKRDYSEWIQHIERTVRAAMALPFWKARGGEPPDLKQKENWNGASTEPVNLGCLWETMEAAGISAAEIPLYQDMNHLLAKGDVAPSKQTAESKLPVYFLKNEGESGDKGANSEEGSPPGQVLKLQLEAVHYPGCVVVQPTDTEGLTRPVFFPHPDCIFVPVGNDFLDGFDIAWKLWANNKKAVFPKDIAFRWKLEPTASPYTARFVDGPSAGFDIWALTGKVLAGLPENGLTVTV